MQGYIFLAVAFFIFALVWRGIKIVPQQQAWIIEHLGKFDRVLEPGMNFLIPFFQRVAYKHSLKEQAIDINSQTAITRDNVTLSLDGVLYVRIIDPKAASYGVTDPYYALTQLAQTTMRSEIGKMIMDQTFEEREQLNVNIVSAINEAAASWGIQCMRYEIRDINPPASILKSMEQQVTAERQKRASILESEGAQQATINLAEGRKKETVLTAEAHKEQVILNGEAQKQQVILASEASMQDQINRAKGEAEAILAVAEANAKGIALIAESIKKNGGEDAVVLKLAEKYIEAFSQMAKTSNTILLPANTGDAGSMVAQAMGVFGAIKNKQN